MRKKIFQQHPVIVVVLPNGLQGHLLAKLYLNRAQAAGFQNSGEVHLKMLYKGNVATDLDSVITLATEVINGKGGVPEVSTRLLDLVSILQFLKPVRINEVIWAAQFDINISLDGRFGGNRSCNYHTGDYTNQTGCNPCTSIWPPFGTFKPTDFAYDNFHDKVYDSRYYKTFSSEYIGNMPTATSTSYTWTTAAATWWNANKPAGEPAIPLPLSNPAPKRILQGKRALIYLGKSKGMKHLIQQW
jgi:hypothetical protein